jgi:tetratricopeptide (TPR) repeat protein
MSLLGKLFGRDSQSTYQRGMHEFNAGRMAPALAAFQKIIEQREDSSDPLRSLSCFYASEAAHDLGLQELLRGNAVAALAYLRPALGWNDHFPELQYHAAVAWTTLGEISEAQAALESVLQQNPDHFEGRLLIAELAFRGGQHVEAEHHLQQARERGCSHRLDTALVELLSTGATPQVAAVLRQQGAPTVRQSV